MRNFTDELVEAKSQAIHDHGLSATVSKLPKRLQRYLRQQGYQHGTPLMQIRLVAR